MAVNLSGLKIEHPGVILKQDFMDEYGLSNNALGRALSVPPNRITGIVNGNRSITADTAMRLSRYFGNSIEFWLNLQRAYDLRQAENARRRIEREVEPHAA